MIFGKVPGEIFRENSPASKEMILGKNHPDYFNKYLKSDDIGVKTIVVEHDYIDRDFLEDFSGYYVRCFSDYKRKCTRLHFFSEKFQQADFDLFLERFDPDFKDKLEESYLGFLTENGFVIKENDRYKMRVPIFAEWIK